MHVPYHKQKVEQYANGISNNLADFLTIVQPKMVATSQPAVSSASNKNSAKSFETIDEKQKRKLSRTIYGDFQWTLWQPFYFETA
jgi:hypothetical protein